jgi:DNA-binding PadR family transcriptional regulator
MEKALGEFEFLVLAALLQLNENAYGVNVKHEIEKRIGRQSSYGAIYTTLTRLEEKGFVRSKLGAATPERGQRAKKHFSVTPNGIQSMKDSLSSKRAMVKGIPALSVI